MASLCQDLGNSGALTFSMSPLLPTLYSFRRCPYAMRARLALAVSRQSVLLREVELKNRPPELYAVSPKGTVPVLVLPDGSVLEESLEIMFWTLGNSDPGKWLGDSIAQRDAMAKLVEGCDTDFKYHLDRYKYASRYPEGGPAEEHRQSASAYLKNLQLRLAARPFLYGEKACLADMAIAPFVRQFAFADRTWFEQQAWPELLAWLDKILASPLFLSIMGKQKIWLSGSNSTLLAWD